jgi:hypothetical protein
MKSKFGELVERLALEIADTPEQVNTQAIMAMYEEVEEIERPLYNELDFQAIERYYPVLMKLGATNLATIALEENPIMAFDKLMDIRRILHDVTANEVLAYAIKHTMLLMLAEQKAKASSGLENWIVPPEQTTESHPNSDPPVPQPDEPPATF